MSYVNIGGAPDISHLEFGLEEASSDLSDLQVAVEADISTLQSEVSTLQSDVNTTEENIAQGVILDPTNNSGGWFTFFDDLCYNSVSSGSVGLFSFRNNGGGSISARQLTSSELNRVGVLGCSTSVTNNTVASAHGSPNPLLLGDSQHVFSSSGFLSALPTLAEDYRVGIGFMSTPATAPTHAVFFTIDRTVSATNWVASCIKNTSTTSVDTGVAISTSASSYQSFRIEINTAATSITFYINGSLVATITTNIPTTAGQNIFPGFYIKKITGTATSFTLNVDWIYWCFKLPTSRGTF